MSNSQFGLLAERRFGPFFITQALGAFNDNVFKNALVIMITFQAAQLTNDQVNFYVSLAGVLFLLGVQATLFGPVKYGILPQHLRDHELVGGNGLVEMGTFLAILLGTMLGGTLIALAGGKMWVAAATVLVAAGGYFAARMI